MARLAALARLRIAIATALALATIAGVLAAFVAGVWATWAGRIRLAGVAHLVVALTSPTGWNVLVLNIPLLIVAGSLVLPFPLGACPLRVDLDRRRRQGARARRGSVRVTTTSPVHTTISSPVQTAELLPGVPSDQSNGGRGSSASSRH